MHPIWNSRRVADIITSNKFFVYQLRGVDSVGVNFALLTKPIAVNMHRDGATAQPVITFIMEPPKLHSEQANRGWGFQIFG